MSPQGIATRRPAYPRHLMLDRSTPAGAKALDLIEDAVVAWLTTVRPDGQPQSSPVWFVFDGTEFLVYSLADTARVRNIVANPRVALNLDSNEGADVVTLEGVARISDDPPNSEHPAYQAKYRQAILRMGYTPEAFARSYPVPIRITPKRWRVE